MSAPLLSVIIPNFNHGRYLKDRIDSVLNQTFQDFELIIIDDCSADHSRQVIEEYRNHHRVSHIIYNDKNSGGYIFQQWKKGINLANGKWIWIAESDDFAEINFLSKLTSKISHKVNLIFSASVIIDESNTKINSTLNWLNAIDSAKWTKDYCTSGKEDFFSFHAYNNIVFNSSAAIFRKAAWEKMEFEPSYLKIAGDWLTFGQLSVSGDVCFVAKELNFWRNHQNTTRAIQPIEKESIKLKEFSQVIKLFKRIFNRHNRKIQHNNYKWILNIWISRFSYKNLAKFKYINPKLPFRLKLKFYSLLIKRIAIEVTNSLKKRMRK